MLLRHQALDPREVTPFMPSILEGFVRCFLGDGIIKLPAVTSEDGFDNGDHPAGAVSGDRLGIVT